MTGHHILRLDDIAPNMNWNVFYALKELFVKYNVRPIIGIIPSNEDPELTLLPTSPFDFWCEMRSLQQDHMWSVALHGYNHFYETTESGTLGINNRSEFSGLSPQVQCVKLSRAKKILEDNGLSIDAFMAPAHSFDLTTIECLKRHGIYVITDGYSLFPYRENGVLFVPQLFARPRRMPCGLYTWCIHPNTMTEKNMRELEWFIERNHQNIICFRDCYKYTKGGALQQVQRILIRNAVLATRKLKKVTGIVSRRCGHSHETTQG